MFSTFIGYFITILVTLYAVASMIGLAGLIAWTIQEGIEPKPKPDVTLS